MRLPYETEPYSQVLTPCMCCEHGTIMEMHGLAASMCACMLQTVRHTGKEQRLRRGLAGLCVICPRSRSMPVPRASGQDVYQLGRCALRWVRAATAASEQPRTCKNATPSATPPIEGSPTLIFACRAALKPTPVRTASVALSDVSSSGAASGRALSAASLARIRS